MLYANLLDVSGISDPSWNMVVGFFKNIMPAVWCTVSSTVNWLNNLQDTINHILVLVSFSFLIDTKLLQILS